MLTSLIYLNPDSISKQLCDEIIHLYENENDKYNGITAGGLNKNVKDTLDFNIPNEEPWTKIKDFLEVELKKNLKMYIDQLNSHNFENENSSVTFKFFDNILCYTKTFMIQRYIKQVGRYIYHNDFDINTNEKSYRIITFLWYLNTVEEGGETEIWGTHKIKPEAGKLLLFPSCWTFPHTGKMPISDNKYIITGWLYVPIKNM